MKKITTVSYILLLIIAIHTHIYAQENMSLGKYSSMRIEKVGKLKGTLNQGMSIREMSGGGKYRFTISRT